MAYSNIACEVACPKCSSCRLALASKYKYVSSAGLETLINYFDQTRHLLSKQTVHNLATIRLC